MSITQNERDRPMKMYRVTVSVADKPARTFSDLSDEKNAVAVAEARVRENLYDRVFVTYYEDGRVVGDGPIWDSLKAVV